MCQAETSPLCGRLSTNMRQHKPVGECVEFCVAGSCTVSHRSSLFLWKDAVCSLPPLPAPLRERRWVPATATIARIWPARSRPRSPAQAAVHRLSRLQPSRAPGSRPPSAAQWLAPPRVSERWLAGACSWHSSCWRTPRAPVACGRAHQSSGSLSALAGARARAHARLAVLPNCCGVLTARL